MVSWDVRLLNGNYVIENNAPVIYLFGVTREGKTITIQYEGFKPYFFVSGNENRIKSELGRDVNLLKTEQVELVVDGKKEVCTRVTIKIPPDVPKYRETFQRKGYRVFASDIPFIQRFVYDMDMGSCAKVFGDELPNDGITTTDLFVKASEFKDCEVFNPRLKILSFDIENSIKDSSLLVIGCVVRDGKELRKEALTGDEKKMIADFVELIRREDPDVITGYNIDGYDFPVILKRAELHGMGSLNIGRDSSRLRSKNERFWTAHGRMIADAWWNAKMEVRPKQETLDHVSKLVLGEGKGDIDPTKMDEEWASNRKKVIDYCLKDAELALRILEKIGSLQKAMDVATVSKLPVDYVLNGRTSTLIDSILIREADKNSIAVPQTHRGRRGDRADVIEGGYVHSIQPGLYNWICVLDFKAMYPSIIISNNICFTTLSPEGETESPIKGVRFMSRDQREGILPKILESLLKDRDNIRAKMAEAKNDDDKRYYYGLQSAVKVLMNAFYGVFASSFYRFTDPKIGASITAFARENIKNIIEVLKSENVVVVYGDTDSVFF
ncbi:MAG: DNA polymerase II, partial [Thermoplasmata archaeon]|nr:DNA polymerase II [Thermoplasmata archaeon]